MRKEVIADDGRSMPGDDKVVACGGEISTGRAPIYQPLLPSLSQRAASALPIITGCQAKSGIQVRSCRKIRLALDQHRNSPRRWRMLQTRAGPSRIFHPILSSSSGQRSNSADGGNPDRSLLAESLFPVSDPRGNGRRATLRAARTSSPIIYEAVKGVSIKSSRGNNARREEGGCA